MDHGAAQASEWHWLWDVYITGACAAAIVVVFLLNGRFPGNAPAAAALLGCIVGWVLTVGRRVPRSGEVSWRTATFVAVPVTMLIIAMWFSQVAIAAIPAVYPIIFSALPLVTAIVVTTAVNLTPLAVDVAIEGWRSPNFVPVVAMTLIGVIIAPLIGTMVVTATRQRTKLAVLVAELEANRAETERLSQAAGVSAERERLAREIHDTLAQGFTSIVALTRAVELKLPPDSAAARRHVELIRATARENLAEARVMVTDLTPEALGEASLLAAIRRQCDRLTAATDIAVSMSAEPNLPALGMAADVALLRITQEAFANIDKHAQASVVQLELCVADGGVRLSLIDNGIGLPDDHTEGFGLRGMRARVSQVGGTMTVSPTPGGGLTIQVAVPT
jgi:signal transduction histidine kinase